MSPGGSHQTTLPPDGVGGTPVSITSLFSKLLNFSSVCFHIFTWRLKQRTLFRFVVTIRLNTLVKSDSTLCQAHDQCLDA